MDDWELDDWEDDSFDEDVWDASQLDDPAGEEFDDELGEEFGDGGGDGGGIVGADDRSGAMSWSAWEVGTVFALGGWLVDRHSEQVGEQVRQALERAGSTPVARQPSHRGAPHPPPPTGYRYGSTNASLRVGDAVDQGVLFGALALAAGTGRDWMVQAEGSTQHGDRLVMVISVVPRTPGPSMWVVAEEHPGGFSPSRLVPVFQPDREGGLAVFATDHAVEAADAAAWACAREGVALDALAVTKHAGS